MTRPRGHLDPITAKIIRGYIISAVREMHQTTVRTAYSTCFSEGEDFNCALFDHTGRMVAQAYGSPAQSGALGDALANIRAAFAVLEEGDVIIHNDPYNGGTHQADVMVCRPIFVDGNLIAFGANRGHWTDIGGMAPGGWSGTARHVVQEALIIPPMKLYRAGEIDESVRNVILRNVRVPDQCWGDLQAQVASNLVMERRLLELAGRYGLEAVLDSMNDAVEYSRRRFGAMLRKLPDGEFSGEEVMEDDAFGGGPYTIRVRVRKRAGRISVDFAGTDAQVRGSVNCSFSVTKSASYNAVMAVVDPTVPINAGVLDLISVDAPAGTLVRPVYPAPVFCGTADPADKVAEAVLKALGELAPERAIAGSYCTGNNVTGSGESPEGGEDFLWYVFESGGCGARVRKDGNDVLWHLMANTKNESMEIWEARYPVRFVEYSLRTDSGGAGQYRGGLGTRRSIEVLSPTSITGSADRHKIPPWGLEGGHAGMPNAFRVRRHDKEYSLTELFGTPSPSKFAHLPLVPGDVLVVSQGGGGGYGDPAKRERDAVLRDVAEGYVSREAALNSYKVAIEEDGRRDGRRTNRPRAKGPARRMTETIQPVHK